MPILTLTNLSNPLFLSSNRDLLKNKKGIYAFVNNINDKQYIGSAKDFYVRLNDHLNRKSHFNSSLQQAWSKYGLDNFNFIIYEYFSYQSKLVSAKTLTNLESKYITYFNHSTLYNFKKDATSMLGYKHTTDTIEKMVNRFKDKSNHPMYNKTHTSEAKLLISKPDSLNPMYGKNS